MNIFNKIYNEAMKNFKLFEQHSAYNTYITGTPELPNVSYCATENEVHFNYLKTNMIIYTASAKLTETTSSKNDGLHTNAFNTTITSHTFENGIGTIEFDGDVTSIGNSAFRSCSGLTSINIPSGITSIDSSAFYGCSGLTSINIPSGVTSIGSSAFSGCSGLTSINIPSGVTSIGNNTFSGCYDLASINIPSGVTSIGDSAFYNCFSLTSVTIPSSVTSIGNNAFYSCAGLTSITSLSTIAPNITNTTFMGLDNWGTLYVPTGSTGYDTWMGTGNYYLGKLNWTKIEQ